MRRLFFHFSVAICLATAFVAARIDAAAATVAQSTDENVIPQQVFDGMRESFRPSKSRGIHIRYQFNLSGPEGGEWWIEVNDGKFKMGRGKIANPHVVFMTSDKDWVALSNGKLNGAWATITGRLKVHGSHALARKLDEVCP